MLKRTLDQFVTHAPYVQKAVRVSDNTILCEDYYHSLILMEVFVLTS